MLNDTSVLVIDQIITFVNPDGKTREERILNINIELGSIVTFNIKEDEWKKSLPIIYELEYIKSVLKNGEGFVSNEDPFPEFSLPDECFLPSDLKVRGNRFKVIQLLQEYPEFESGIYDLHIRGRLVFELVSKHRINQKVVYEVLRLWWRSGEKVNGLVGKYKNSGAKGKKREYTGVKLGRPRDETKHSSRNSGQNVDDTIKRSFRLGLRKFYLNKKGISLLAAYRKTINTFFSDGVDDKKVPIFNNPENIPTYPQFKYLYEKENDIVKTNIIRKGKHFFNTQLRAIIGDSRMGVFGPGFMYQVDAAIGDLYLVSSLDRRRIIGKPVIYMIIDVFSELIVGFAVTLEGPSWLGAVLALENLFTNKAEYCARFGFEISENDWPSRYPCRHFLADNGEFKSKNSDVLPSSLKISILNTPAYRPDWKSLIERMFRICKDEVIQWIPGFVYPKRDRTDPDYRLDACLTLNEFRTIIIDFILTYNKYHVLSDYRKDEFMISDHVRSRPLDLWNWGITHRSGSLRKPPLDKIRISLLPKADASVTLEGIKLDDLRYTCKEAEEKDWYSIARIKGSWTIPCAYYLDSTNQIHVFPGQGEIWTCHLMGKDKKYEDREFYEIEDAFLINRRENEALSVEDNRQMGGFDNRTDEIVSKAQTETEELREGMSKHAIVSDIHENREQEKKLDLKKSFLSKPDEEESPISSKSDRANKSREFPEKGLSYIPETFPVDILKEKIQKSLVRRSEADD